MYYHKSSLCQFMILGLLLSGCTHDPAYYPYQGKLSTDLQVDVLEKYVLSGGKWELTYAEIDTDGDGVLDLDVDFQDFHGSKIASIYRIKQVIPEKTIHGSLARQDTAALNELRTLPRYMKVRPLGRSTPEALREIAGALNSNRDTDLSIDALSSKSSNEAWIGALELYRQKHMSARTLETIASQFLIAKRPDCYAFALSGQGKSGACLLAKGLYSSAKPVVRAAAYYLESMGAEAAVALPDLLERLADDKAKNRSWFSGAIMGIAEADPELVIKFKERIEKFRYDKDKNVRCHVESILGHFEKPAPENEGVDIY